MKTPAKQFAHLRRQSTDRLRALVPHDVPIVVIDTPPTWAIHHLLTSPDTPPLYVARRFEVAVAWLRGYVAGQGADTTHRLGCDCDTCDSARRAIRKPPSNPENI